MTQYILQRLLQGIPTLLVISAITFFLGYFAPGDPVSILLGQHASPEARERVRRELGLDRPILVQYGHFLYQALQGDLGISYVTRRPVVEILQEKVPVTASLAVMAMGIACGLGVSIGILSALYQNRWIDRLVMFSILSGISLPAFVLAPFLILVFALWLRILPVAGWSTPLHWVLPAWVLSTRPTAMIARLTRAQMIEVLQQDYIRAAYARGLPPAQILWRHALPNTLPPVLTVAGTSFGYLLSGSFVVETIFAVPGIGYESVSAIFARDYPLIQATTLLMAVSFVVINLIIDLLYGWLDPRITSIPQ